jgi:predicted DNA-binding protein (UPF0251 family)
VAPPLEDTTPEPRSTLQPERAAEMGEIFAAIGRLPEDFRLALVAVDVLGLSYQEAAAALDTREATITTRIYRARQRIAREFGDAPTDAPASAARSAAAGSPTPSGGAPAADNPSSAREGNQPNRSLA